MKRMKNVLMMTIAALLLSSCAKEVFTANKIKSSHSTGTIDTNTSTQCSSFTLVKPHVNFVFMWDNSGSQSLMTSDLKNALNRTIFKISERFDYRIMVAPILDPLSQISYVADNPDGTSVPLISKEEAFARLGSMSSVGGSHEPGLDNTLTVLQRGASNGFLRKNAHTIVVLMSNGDDYDPSPNCAPRACYGDYIASRANAIKNLLSSTLASESYHFYALVPNTKDINNNSVSCSGVGTSYPSKGYIEATKYISGSLDHINICTTAFAHVFDSINNSIEETVLKHKYNYWPIIETTVNSAQEPFDATRITVTKMISGNPVELTEGVDWNYLGYRSGLAIRYSPTAGEKTSGYFISLKNNGVVTYPECLRIDTQEPATCYGYVQLQNKPLESSIVLKINGQIISRSTTNGWEYIGYKASQNVRTQCAGSSYAPGSELKSGHFLKLHGSAVYGNNSTVELSYDPTSL